MKAILFTDGGVRTGGKNGPTAGRTGRAAIGYVIKSEDGLLLDKGGMEIGEATVNECEYCALIRGLYVAHELGVRDITVKCDSQLIVNQILGEWRCREQRLAEYKHEALVEADKFDSFEIVWVPREDNQHADLITRIYLD